MVQQTHAVHGGDFFKAIGEEFEDLGRSASVVSADVLDAWYDPSPNAVGKVAQWLPWLMRTSPPTHGEGLRRVLARTRGLPEEALLLGSGTSSLMYAAFPRLVRADDLVVLLDPMYGEYAHLFENVLGCRVRRHRLPSEEGFRPHPERIAEDCRDAALLVLVNPNSPTGNGMDTEALAELLRRLSPRCRVWVDETYVDFAPDGWSGEPLVPHDPRLIVCKSMSKFYALSGLRIGYLAADPDWIRALEPMSPPWSVGLIAQVAAVEALKDRAYYRAMRDRTAELRADLAASLSTLPGVRKVYPSVTNFLLFRVGEPGAAEVARRCSERGVFLRNCDSLSPRFRDDHLRTAVKDAETNLRILDALAAALA
ncbi:MAG: histidinol-phosphate aminotransferase family protein [Fimbriimonadales bacterium]|nr:histidinol-phosphate aminotransferase family protein [Fimbriimonadales bacterium]